MTLLFQSRIYREDLKANRSVLYVFGDNMNRVGLGGQAGQMRGEPNAVGVATKWNPTMHMTAFFRDCEFELLKPTFDKDLTPVLTALQDKRLVIWPLDGIGTGLSELPIRAPKIHEYLQSVLRMLTTL